MFEIQINFSYKKSYSYIPEFKIWLRLMSSKITFIDLKRIFISSFAFVLYTQIYQKNNNISRVFHTPNGRLACEYVRSYQDQGINRVFPFETSFLDL